MNDGVMPGSFRDPSGVVFRRGGRIYRQVNATYQENYDRLMQSGLYTTLVGQGALIPHTKVDIQHAITSHAYLVIQPDVIPFVSYPYEWCSSQLKHAALLTLKIQMTALDFGLSLKDASAYNIQFLNGKPIFIDTLSFERYRAGQPWVAYRQFCQHFLAPLALGAYVDVRLQQLLRSYIDGIPLDLASTLLPARTRADLGLLAHIHLHARAQKRLSDHLTPTQLGGVGQTALRGLVESLRATIKKLKRKDSHSEWRAYYASSNYSSGALKDKHRMVSQMLTQLSPPPKMVWDLGGNIGLFSRLASERGMTTISLDADPAVVEQNYLDVVAKGEIHLLPLWLDLTNPSPGLGWANQERMSLQERGPADLVLALALIHHLAIGNNLPLEHVIAWLSQIGRAAIIEFVPKDDPQCQKLLARREDIFDQYSQEIFERACARFFTIDSQARIADTNRVLYLLSRREE